MANAITYICDIFEADANGSTVTSSYSSTPRQALMRACMGISVGDTRRMLVERLQASPEAETPAQLHMAIREAFDLRFSRYEGSTLAGAIACIA